MAWILQPNQATDGKMLSTVPGLKLFAAGPFYVQWGATASINTSTTETTLFNSASTAVSNFGSDYPNSTSSLVIPANALTLGTQFQARLVGTIGNTSTPNITIKSYLGTTSIATTGTFAMSTITGAMDFEILLDVVVTAIGTSGQVGTRMKFSYNTAQGTSIVNSVPFALTTIDTTAQYTFDTTVTWGASSSSNAIITKFATVGLIG